MFLFDEEGTVMGKKVFQEVTAKQAINRVKEPRMPFDWSINPYRGCTHGCSFCYARTTHTFLGMEADDSFQNNILLKTNAPEALEAQLAKVAKRHRWDLEEAARHIGLVAMGTATDPYQPIEAKAKITRECLKVLAKYQIPTSITTRSPLILRDMDILREVPVASINISISTLNKEVYQRLEPAAPYPLKRLETVQTLVENGLPAGVFIAPILPYLTDSAEVLEELAASISASGARFALPSVLRLTPGVKEWYFQVLKQDYPHLLPAYEKLYPRAYPQAGYVEALRRRIYGLLEAYGLPADVPVRPIGKPAGRLQTGEQVEQLSFSF
jgi:DNA repair photolyase